MFDKGLPDALVKVENSLLLSFQQILDRTREEYSNFSGFWPPASAGVMPFVAFSESIKLHGV